jgi:hypothetical protein
VCSDDCCIDEGADIVELDLQLFEYALPEASSCPASEAVVHGLPRAISFMEVSPGNARTHTPQHSVDEVSVAAFPYRPWTDGKKRLDKLPLRICQFMSMVHSKR